MDIAVMRRVVCLFGGIWSCKLQLARSDGDASRRVTATPTEGDGDASRQVSVSARGRGGAPDSRLSVSNININNTTTNRN